MTGAASPAEAGSLDLVLHDYGAYPFTLELGRALADRGHRVRYVYSGSVRAPNVLGGFRTEPDGRLETEAIPLSRPIDKTAFVRRWLREAEYGRRLARAALRGTPDVVLSANTPLESQQRLLRACRRRSVPLVYWVQDLYGVAAHRLLRRKLPVLGEPVGRHYRRLEKRLVRRSDFTVVITEEFTDALDGAIDPARSAVVPNWAPLDEHPVRPRDNDWARERGLQRGVNFVYAGTLGMKHDPSLLLRLAAAVGGRYDGRVVVVSEGEGAEWLAAEGGRRRLGNLRVLPFQPADRLPDVLGSADVLVALLEADAGAFSVPSKVLTYLCAGRPVLGSLPPDNLAARIVAEAGAGSVVAPGDPEAFAEAGRRLLVDPERRATLGRGARRYAEETFDIGAIADRFEGIFGTMGVRQAE